MNATLDRFFPLFHQEPEDDLDIKFLKEIKDYHSLLLKKVEEAYHVAETARSKGLDPERRVEIPVAKNMAERVEKLIGIPIAKRIEELEESGLEREKICFKIAEEIIKGEFGKFDVERALDLAIRSAVAILTEGVVAAPIEGIARVGVGNNYDGSKFLKIYYAGPIRSAGGTAQVISVLVGDYVRRIAGLNRYIPTEEEILRYIEEIPLYKKVANLQYLPSDEEIRLIVSNCPVCIDGEPTEDAEVSGHRNLERVETNRVRGGMALVIAEGIALKAPKLKKMVDELKLTGWEWLDKLINKESKKEEKKDSNEKEEIKPKDKYLSDIVAGRPVFSHPSRKGGFRLRYGRARNSGFATVGINPATMKITGDFIAIGTQMKIERPGKAGGVVPVSTIDGPTVRLKNGDVVKINTIKQAEMYKDRIDAILDIGEILINYGDFLENNHPLLPASYCYEWWREEVKNILHGDFRNIDEDEAIKLCDEYGVPLHPDHTYLWHDIDLDELIQLRDYVSEKGKIEGKYGKSCLIFPLNRDIKTILEKILIEHKVRDGFIVLEKWKVFARCLGLDGSLKKIRDVDREKDVLENIRYLSGLDVRAKAPARIGARMGRPEKAKERRMSPPPHMLFPLGQSGGNTRDLKNAINYMKSYNSAKGEIEVDLPVKICERCGKETIWSMCECGGFAHQAYYCPRCDRVLKEERCPRCGGEANGFRRKKINVRELYEKALENLGEREVKSAIKGVIGLTNKNKVCERIEKGILRAKHGVFVFKDGTIRYDMTDLPLTHFKPSEIGISIEKLKELGYSYDYRGKPLTDEDQIVELKPQDIILAKDAGEYMLRVSQFIDELLVKFYGMEPFYNAEKLEDLIGHLVIGLAPHTSAGVLGRIIGFADVLAGYAHPYFHAAKRRNCDGDEDCVMLLLDGLLNFSHQFLPDKRGGRMDAPLVLTTILDPKEVDSEVHNMDVVESYPLEFYRATLRYANPKELEGVIERVEDRLKSERRYYGLRFTHDTDNIAGGVKVCAYKSLKTMQDKVNAQMSIAEKLFAVDEHDVAERVITTHFLPDLIGNLRAFSKQEFRCVKCNTKYRRVPLKGKCYKCGGNIILTVHESSIKKYLELSKFLSEKYNVSNYTKQRLMLIELEINSLFENENSRQIKISEFF
ncbi:DNA polymerase II large subunit [Archaeoglobus sulfaticallidus PM70-1]|uniref:DNA polymerase II large subunit n=1 Tax=Archaeoglobus sulfaticallidus PM70-1 TaxID=387631 RepID=N0BCB8_9EURY|nr:DNA polymerase II large subunit [Archaeoglobus sulfaticallidus]AGK60633.1 DNA polymerase II large subunit [Archaeoglobus sulfaticallidus PM70-1]